MFFQITAIPIIPVVLRCPFRRTALPRMFLKTWWFEQIRRILKDFFVQLARPLEHNSPSVKTSLFMPDFDSSYYGGAILPPCSLSSFRASQQVISSSGMPGNEPSTNRNYRHREFPYPAQFLAFVYSDVHWAAAAFRIKVTQRHCREVQPSNATKSRAKSTGLDLPS